MQSVLPANEAAGRARDSRTGREGEQLTTPRQTEPEPSMRFPAKADASSAGVAAPGVFGEMKPSAAKAACALALERLDRKQQIVSQLIDGRIDLLEAAARFRPFVGPASPMLADAVPTETDCRLVIGWVGLALSDRPEKAAALTQRLEQELTEYLERQGYPS
jgi:hypothetical protein